MSEFNEVANSPMDVEFSGKKYKVRRVPLDTIFGKAETSVLSLQMKRVHEMSVMLDGEEKTSFLAKAMLESLPSGERLNQMVLSFLRSPDGVKMVLFDAMRKDHPDIEKDLDLATLLNSTSEDAKNKIRMIFQFATGRSGKKAEAPLSESGPEKKS